MKTNKQTISFMIDENLSSRLNKYAKIEKIEKSKVIRKALEIFLDRQLGIQKMEKNQ